MSRYLTPLALAIALVSLGLNVVLLVRLNQARVGALSVLDRTSRRLDALAEVSLRQTVRVNQAVVVAGELPFQQDFNLPVNTTFPVNMQVPISTTVPINTTARVNVTTLLGPVEVPVTINTTVPVNLEVPLNTTVPVDLQVPVSISRTVPYSLTIPIDLQVPVEVRLRDIGIQSAIQEIQQEIQNLRGALQ